MQWKYVFRLAWDRLTLKIMKNVSVIVVAGIALLLCLAIFLQVALVLKPVTDIRLFFGTAADKYYNITMTYLNVDDTSMSTHVLEFAHALQAVPEVECAGYLKVDTIAFQELMDDATFTKINAENISASNGAFSGMNMLDILKRYATVIQVSSEEFLKYMKVQYQTVETFTVKDGVYPVLVGSAFRNVLSVGDFLTQKTVNGERIYKVVGFVDAQSQYFSAYGLENGLLSADYVFFTLSDLHTLPNDFMAGMNLASSIYWVKAIDVSAEQAVAAVNQLALSHQLSIKSSSVVDVCEKMVDDMWEDIRPLVIFVAFALAISMISVTSVMVVTILTGRRELGVLYANGFSTADLLRILLAENFVKIFCAVLLAIIGYEWIMHVSYSAPFIAMNRAQYVVALPFVAVVAFVLFIIASLVPLILVKRQQPIKLLRSLN